ncbi:hypothetical protein [Belnapia mucosa]|nr:hypothetical protein [Belnapia mucosa]
MWLATDCDREGQQIGQDTRRRGPGFAGHELRPYLRRWAAAGR